MPIEGNYGPAPTQPTFTVEDLIQWLITNQKMKYAEAVKTAQEVMQHASAGVPYGQPLPAEPLPTPLPIESILASQMGPTSGPQLPVAPTMPYGQASLPPTVAVAPSPLPAPVPVAPASPSADLGGYVGFGGQLAPAPLPASPGQGYFPTEMVGPEGPQMPVYRNEPAVGLEEAVPFEYTAYDGPLTGVGIGGQPLSESEMAANYRYNQMVSQGIPSPVAGELAMDYIKALDRTAADTSLARAQTKAMTDLKIAGIKSDDSKYMADQRVVAEKVQADALKYQTDQNRKMRESVAEIMSKTDLSQSEMLLAMKLATTPIDSFGTMLEPEEVIKRARAYAKESGVAGGKIIPEERFTPNDIQNLANQFREFLKKGAKEDELRAKLKAKGTPDKIIEEIMKRAKS